MFSKIKSPLSYELPICLEVNISRIYFFKQYMKSPKPNNSLSNYAEYRFSRFSTLGFNAIVICLALAGAKILQMIVIRLVLSIQRIGHWDGKHDIIKAARKALRGNIEEISSTYVVVKLGDLRRLIVPLNYFIQNAFKNWACHDPSLIGSVPINADYAVKIAEVRTELKRIVSASALWNHKTCSPRSVTARSGPLN